MALAFFSSTSSFVTYGAPAATLTLSKELYSNNTDVCATADDIDAEQGAVYTNAYMQPSHLHSHTHKSKNKKGKLNVDISSERVETS